MMPAEEGMSFRTGFMRITALPRCSASSTCSNRGSGHVWGGAQRGKRRRRLALELKYMEVGGRC